MKEITIIGLMSGSSLDGVDIASIKFTYELTPGFRVENYQITASKTVTYPQKWVEILPDVIQSTTSTYFEVDVQLGRWYGKIINDFIAENALSPELISIHGHTVRHDPPHGVSIQAGSGYAVHAVTGLPVTCEFRRMDVLYGGQGAPMAPIMDMHLFNEFDVMLNFGGVANITVKKDDTWTGFDICPCNQILNYLARQITLPFDRDGQLAAKGKVYPDLLNKLKSDPYLKLPAPKSMSNHYVIQQYFSLLDYYNLSIEDRLATSVAFIADQVHDAISSITELDARVLCTGGGAHNKYLVEQLRTRLTNLTVPDDDIVDYKECILMALMGLMRLHDIVNFKQSITGGSKDHIGGILVRS